MQIRATKRIPMDVWEYADSADVFEVYDRTFGSATCQAECDARLGDFVAELARAGFEPAFRPRVTFVNSGPPRYFELDCDFRRKAAK